MPHSAFGRSNMIIPFFIPHAGCPHQCVFCDQRRISGAAKRPDPASIPAIIEQYLRSARRRAPAEIAFYGGTFTALPLEDQRSYLEAVRPFIASGVVRNIRVSTRPDAVTAGIIEHLKRHHVATVELGVQSLDDNVLHRSGRGHSADDTVHAAALLKREGFTIGFQLMPGLPGDDATIFRATVAKALSLRPDLVRIYPTLVIRDTPLEQLYRDGRYRPLALESARALCADAVKTFRDAGIPVIRVGLQPTEELSRPGAVVAGPFHPAFGQLVESSLLLVPMRAAMQSDRPAILYVHPGDLSPAIGHGRENIAALRREFHVDLRILPDSRVRRGTVAAEQPCARGKDTL
jgi:histone acetyltransferase (RNA polymerase elongator complex component)